MLIINANAMKLNTLLLIQFHKLIVFVNQEDIKIKIYAKLVQLVVKLVSQQLSVLVVLLLNFKFVMDYVNVLTLVNILMLMLFVKSVPNL